MWKCGISQRYVTFIATYVHIYSLYICTNVEVWSTVLICQLGLPLYVEGSQFILHMKLMKWWPGTDRE
jgi:hypothetical protein